MEGLWTYLLYFYGLIVDAVSLCENPVKLHANELNQDQYLGRWLFIAAAAPSPSSLETFAHVDSILFSMNQRENPEQLRLQAAIRLKTGQCVPKSWNYLLKEESADLATEGRPHMRTELFSAKCPNSIIVQEIDQDYQRILFYSRILYPAEDCLADFWNKASCLDMNELLLIPRTQDACEFQET
ncbi:apolipoprotein M [Candoia aspera]|uniref:apolipoprotein M n=1 Tax=Candoia aspera TaxID=51853 RepID=UPI002FD836E4